MLSWHAFSMVGWVACLIAKRRLNKGRNRPALHGSRMPRDNPYGLAGHVKFMKIDPPRRRKPASTLSGGRRPAPESIRGQWIPGQAQNDRLGSGRVYFQIKTARS